MDDLSRLAAIEQIKLLKARYFYCVDNKQWRQWVDLVWAPDAELHVPAFREEPFRGASEIAEWSAAMLADCVSVHHGYTPIIDILSADEASGIWTMDDMIIRQGAAKDPAKPAFFRGWGYYHERYTRTPQGWRILSSRLSRLHVETRS